jgi:hypothetical protein
MSEQYMMFYLLGTPDCDTDEIYDRTNPVTFDKQMRFPWVSCQACGQNWGGYGLTAWPVPTKVRDEYFSGPLAYDRWVKLKNDYLNEIGLPLETQIWPGDGIGLVTAELKYQVVPDIIHPWLGPLLFNERAMNIMKSLEATGASLPRIQCRYSKKLHFSNEPPALYQLVVTGTAKCVGSLHPLKRLCDICGRPENPEVCTSGADIVRWDGSDIFNLDGNTLKTYVTSRIRDALLSANISNIEFEELNG